MWLFLSGSVSRYGVQSIWETTTQCRFEASADVGRDSDADTAAMMRNMALDEAAKAIEIAYEEFVPKSASRDRG